MTRMTYLGFLFLVCIFFYETAAGKLPSYLPARGKCPLETLDQCLEERIDFFRPYLAKGVPEIGVPSLEPLYMKHVSLTQGAGAVAIHSDFRNLVLHGFSNYSVNYVRLNLKSLKFEISLFAPTLKIDTDYEMKGKVLLLPIQGHGTAYALIKNITATFDSKLSFIHRKDHTYLRVNDPSLKFDIDHLYIHFNNLFNGQRLLGETMNKFIEENWREVFNDIKKSLDQPIKAFITSAIQPIFDLLSVPEFIDVSEEHLQKDHKDQIIYEDK